MRLLLPFLLAATPAAAETVETWNALRTVDARLATIAYRLTTANAALCRDLQPATGLVLHAVDQYPREVSVRAAFGFPAPLAVEAVVAGSPAGAAGVLPDDGVTAIDARPAPAPTTDGAQTSVTRDAAEAAIAALPPGAPLRLSINRAGTPVAVTLSPRPACRSRFEVLTGTKLDAHSDGQVVQIGARFFERFDDDEIAVVVAHELSHTILRHRARLEAAGVKWGLLAEFGRNGRLFRRTEDEADLLGAYLLRNAGYDPALAVRFWRGNGAKIDGGFFRSRTHASAKARADAIEAELARLPPGAPTPYAPPLLAERDRPLQ